MRHERTLAPGARIFGCVVLTALALLSLGWIIRDLTQAAESVDVWWMWTGVVPRAEDGVWVTSSLEPTLLLVYAVSAAMVVRSSAAAGLLVATGTLTLLVRTPGLWIPTANWTQGVEETLEGQLLFTTLVLMVLAAVLLVTAAVGHRPQDTAEGYDGPPANPLDEPPALPTPGGGALAFLLLGAAGLTVAAWEVHSWYALGWKYYSRTLTGERSTLTLLSVPPGWLAWTLVALLLVGAYAALVRAGFARPLGLVLAGALLGYGVFPLAYAVRMRLFENVAALDGRAQLHLASLVLETLAGLIALLALAARGVGKDGAAPGKFAQSCRDLAPTDARAAGPPECSAHPEPGRPPKPPGSE